MSIPPGRPRERNAFATLAVLTLAPVVLQALWRPLAQLMGAEADTLRVTYASLLVATATVVTHLWVGHPPRRGVPLLAGVLTVVPLALGLGEGTQSVIAVALSLAAVAAFSATVLPWLIRSLPVVLDGLASQRKVLAALLLLVGLAGVNATTRLSVFMGDAGRPELSMAPEIPFFLHHSCLTAYVEGARLATLGVDNLYDTQRWPDLNGTAREDAWHGPYAPFGLDAFAYPPQFLLLPRVLLSPLGDFASQRALWFALNGLLTAAGLWTVATWLGGRGGLSALLLAPIVWVSPPTLGTLQVGNVHIAVMVAAMLALVAFETRRHAVGGALLAFAILSKISPGLLLVFLLVRGRVREVAWTVGFGVVYTLAALLAFGPAPFIDFVSYELPRLSSGEALTFLTGAESVPINLAPFGLPFKLAALGVEVGDPWAMARSIGSAYTLAIVVLTVLAARRRTGARATAEMWAALLALASLRSPLAPGYVTFALLWLLSIRAGNLRGPATAFALGVTWLLLAVTPPLVGDTLIAWSMAQQALVLGVAAFGLLSASNRPEEAPSG